MCAHSMCEDRTKGESNAEERRKYIAQYIHVASAIKARKPPVESNLSVSKLLCFDFVVQLVVIVDSEWGFLSWVVVPVLRAEGVCAFVRPTGRSTYSRDRSALASTAAGVDALKRHAAVAEFHEHLYLRSKL